jgi:hypothetical protein
MKVVCIGNYNDKLHLTIDKEYEVVFVISPLIHNHQGFGIKNVFL